MRGLLASMLLALLLVPANASAEGWWSSIQLERATVAPGQEARIRATAVLFESLEAAERARDTQFYVYVLRGFDDAAVRKATKRADPGSWWRLGDADPFRVGRVRLTIPAGSNLASARARFRVPGVSAGTYALMLCDAGCRHPLADVIPVDLRVVPDAFTAALAARVERLESRAARRRALAGRVERLEVQAGRMEARAAELRATIRLLEAQPAEARHAAEAPGWAYAGWLLAGALLSGLGALFLRRRRAPREASLDDALAQLLAEEGKPRPRARVGR